MSIDPAGVLSDLAAMSEKPHTQRIVLSRHTLNKYRKVPGGTSDAPEALLQMIREEIEILEQIAIDRGGSQSVARLIEQWREFAGQQKTRAH